MEIVRDNGDVLAVVPDRYVLADELGCGCTDDYTCDDHYFTAEQGG